MAYNQTKEKLWDRFTFYMYIEYSKEISFQFYSYSEKEQRRRAEKAER